MSRLLILYGTTEGQTAKIARALADSLCAQGDLVDVVAAEQAPDPGLYAGIVVAASVHAGHYQAAVRQWVRTHATRLRTVPTAFVSVSLGVLQREPKVQQEVAAIVDRFLRETGWTPALSANVAGALVYTRYNWIKRWFMRRIAKAAGGDTDTSRDYEYTDWTQVESLARAFNRHVHPVPADAA